MLEDKVEIKVGNSFEPVPADKYTCQVVDVNAVQQANSFKGGIMETRLNYQFAILDPKKEDDKFQALRGRFLWRRTSLSLNEKSWLYKLAMAIKGSPMTQEEKESFDPESLVGKQVDVMTEVTLAKNGNTYTNIISFSHCKNELETVEYEPKPKEIEKSSSPAVAPKDEEVVDDFIKGLEEDKKNSK